MHADWALLRHAAAAAAAVAALEIQSGRTDPGQLITMAGYSRDPGKGGGGTRLTFDPACLSIAAGRRQQRKQLPGLQGCVRRRGGTAVCQWRTPFQRVISAGDGANVSTFVPVTTFAVPSGCTSPQAGASGFPAPGRCRTGAVRHGSPAGLGQFNLLLPLPEARHLVGCQRVETARATNPFWYLSDRLSCSVIGCRQPWHWSYRPFPAGD